LRYSTVSVGREDDFLCALRAFAFAEEEEENETEELDRARRGLGDSMVGFMVGFIVAADMLLIEMVKYERVRSFCLSLMDGMQCVSLK
jgi:hypothetical protein